MSLRLRLTLWYTALLAGLLLLIMVMAVSRVGSNVRANIDSELKRKGDQVVRLLELTVPSSPLSSLIVPALNAVSEPEIYVQVQDQTRRSIHRSNNLGGVLIQFPESYFKQAMNGTAGYYNVTWVRPDDVRVYFAPVTFGGEVIATVQIDQGGGVRSVRGQRKGVVRVGSHDAAFQQRLGSQGQRPVGPFRPARHPRPANDIRPVFTSPRLHACSDQRAP